MKLKERFLALIDLFEGLGKEMFCFLVLDVGVVLLCKHLIDGGQFVDFTKCIGVAYITGATVGSTANSILSHLKNKASQLKTEVTNVVNNS